MKKPSKEFVRKQKACVMKNFQKDFWETESKCLKNHLQKDFWETESNVWRTTFKRISEKQKACLKNNLQKDFWETESMSEEQPSKEWIYEEQKRNVWRPIKRMNSWETERDVWRTIIKKEFSDKQKSVWESKNNVWKTEKIVWWTGRKKERKKERKNSFHRNRNRMSENQSDGFWKIAILIVVLWDSVNPSKKRNRKKLSGMGCLPWTLSATVLLMRVAAADDFQLGWSTQHSLMGEERWIDRRARSGDFLSLFPLFIFRGFFVADHKSNTFFFFFFTSLSLSCSLVWLLVLSRMSSSSSSIAQQLLHYIGNSRKQEGDLSDWVFHRF